MAFNLAKKYPELLEIMHYNEFERKKSLRAIFDRDITDNDSFKFNDKQIRPTKKDGEIDLENVLHHITTEEVEITEENKKIKKRIFEKYRSMRLHWIKPHIELSINDKIEYFSIIERDEKKRVDVTRTYLYNISQKYVVVLEPQNSKLYYYLLTAYYLNRDYGDKMMKKKLKKKLDVLY